jgi:hypothetical protein
MGDNGRRMIHGFGWFTSGSAFTPRARTRGRKFSATPKRYPKLQPFSPRELLVISQLTAERLARTVVA